MHDTYRPALATPCAQACARMALAALPWYSHAPRRVRTSPTQHQRCARNCAAPVCARRCTCVFAYAPCRPRACPAPLALLYAVPAWPPSQSCSLCLSHPRPPPGHSTREDARPASPSQATLARQLPRMHPSRSSSLSTHSYVAAPMDASLTQQLPLHAMHPSRSILPGHIPHAAAPSARNASLPQHLPLHSYLAAPMDASLTQQLPLHAMHPSRSIPSGHIPQSSSALCTHLSCSSSLCTQYIPHLTAPLKHH